jgi:4-diphosphocytidyl-2-C-methyl-D-erythritol kinase
VTVITELAAAKLNLALHVRARRPDGYHLLETLFTFCAAGDRLEGQLADELSLEITGAYAADLMADQNNLVLRAATVLRATYNVRNGAALTLQKNLPVASGIGGGSADAAATLRLLCKLWSIDRYNPQIIVIAEQLGADVPACLVSQTSFASGVGEQLRPIAGLAGMPVLLVNPGIALSTAAVFKAWDAIDHGPLLLSADLLETAQAARNDLEPPARRLCPVIDKVLAALAQPGALLVRMSGSGATCFALFESIAARDAADQAIAALHPGWWRLASELLP